MASGTSVGGLGWGGLEDVRRNWGWFLALGVCLIVLGCIALVYSVAATLASVLLFGWLLIVGGVLQVIHAFRRKDRSGLALDLITGILYLIAGVILVWNPVAGAEFLTLVIAAFLVVAGIFRIAVSVGVRFRNWGWLLVSGIISLLLGILIWAQWPLSGLWVIGLFVGIDMLFNGWSLVMLGLLARQLPEHAH